jgi:sulfite reductase beta subunit-like hemoprotein
MAMTRSVAREVVRDIAAMDVPALLERMLAAYQQRRRDADETFNDFVRRHSSKSCAI